MTEILDLEAKLRALREEFDGAFARRPDTHRRAGMRLLFVRVGDVPYAVRTDELSGVHLDSPVTPAPSPVAELRGVTGRRGQLIAVYDLAAMLGHAAASRPRWLAVATNAPVAFAFEALERYREVFPEAISEDERADARALAPARVRDGAEVRPLLNVRALIAEVERRAHVARGAEAGAADG